MPYDLPESLAYLGPVLDALSKFDPETLNEDNAEAEQIVAEALEKHTEQLDPGEKQNAIAQDMAILMAWGASRNPPPASAYLVGAMMGFAMFCDDGPEVDMPTNEKMANDIRELVEECRNTPWMYSTFPSGTDADQDAGCLICWQPMDEDPEEGCTEGYHDGIVWLCIDCYTNLIKLKKDPVEYFEGLGDKGDDF